MKKITKITGVGKTFLLHSSQEFEILLNYNVYNDRYSLTNYLQQITLQQSQYRVETPLCWAFANANKNTVHKIVWNNRQSLQF